MPHVGDFLTLDFFSGRAGVPINLKPKALRLGVFELTVKFLSFARSGREIGIQLRAILLYAACVLLFSVG